MLKKLLVYITGGLFALTLQFAVSYASELIDKSPTTASSTDESEVENNEVAPLIIGGSDSTIINDPYMVALLSTGGGTKFQRQFCGGSLLNERWVITAAHCVKGEKPTSINVLVGASCLDEIDTPCSDFDVNFQRTGDEVGVSRIVIHPAYNSRFFKNDIALIELSENVSETSGVYDFAELPASPTILPDDDGLAGLILGWGADSEFFGDPLTYAQVLQFGYVEILTPLVGAPCESWGARYDSKTQICVRGFTYSDGIGNTPAPCFGDSGGPLMYDDEGTLTIVGIASYVYAYGCQDTYQPPVYTRVTSYLDWINKNAKSKQAITFTQPPTLTPTSALSFTLDASSSSGRDVVFTSLSSTCSVDSNSGEIVAASLGTCRISASQPGDESYLPATSVVRSFKIAKLPQTVQVTDVGGFPARNLTLVPSQVISGITVNTSHTGDMDPSLISSSVIPKSEKICQVIDEVVYLQPQVDRDGNPIVVDGSTLYESGTCTVEIWKEGNVDYLPSKKIKYSFKIAKKSQKISFSAVLASTGKRATTISLNSSDTVLISADSLLSNNTSTGLGNAAINSFDGSICTVNDGFLDIYAIGTCKLYVSAEGNQDYSSAKPLTYSINITKANPDIYYGLTWLPGSEEYFVTAKDGLIYTLGDVSFFEAWGYVGYNKPFNELTYKFSNKNCGQAGTSIIWVNRGPGTCTVSVTAPSDANHNKVTRTYKFFVKNAP